MASREPDPSEVLSRPAEAPDLVLRYADHADGLIDVFLPVALTRPEQPAGLLLLVHGGFWRSGFDRVHLRPLAGALRREGFVVALPEYRRGGGAWPAAGADVAAALHAVPDLVGGAAPERVDPTGPVVVAGHSAGGHLALWAGLRAGPGRVRSVVALAPVADLLYAARTGMGGNAVQDLLGAEPEESPDVYADADPLRMLPSTVSVTIVQGADDEQVPADANRRVAAAYPDIRYVELAGVDHFALIDPLSPAFRDGVLPLLRD